MLKVAIVDDHRLFRSSLKLMVSSFDGVKVVFDAENGKDLLQKLKTNTADIVLLDIQMPQMDGYEASTVLHRLYPSLKILALSHLSDRASVQKILDCGAHGFLTKNCDHGQLQKAIYDTHKNGYYFDHEIGAVLHDLIVRERSGKQEDPLEHLSERDLQLIRLIAGGLSNAQVADRLFITIRTVESHRRRIMEKTCSKNFTNVILQAIKFNYLTAADL